MRILVTRPEPDAQAQAETLAARGHEAVLAPLLIVETIPRAALGLDGAQAVIVTSRNTLRALAGHAEREQAFRLPLFAVGEASALKAMKVGFADVTAGTEQRAGPRRSDRQRARSESGPARASLGRDARLRPQVGARSTRLRGQAQDPLPGRARAGIAARGACRASRAASSMRSFSCRPARPGPSPISSTSMAR